MIFNPIQSNPQSNIESVNIDMTQLTRTDEFLLRPQLEQYFQDFIKENCIADDNDLTCYTNYWEFCTIYSLYLSQLDDENLEEAIRKDTRSSTISDCDWRVFAMNFINVLCRTNKLRRTGESQSIRNPALLLGIRFRSQHHKKLK